MSVGLLLITHPGIGPSLLNSARRIVGETTLNTMCLDVPVDTNLERLSELVTKQLEQLEQGEGVLILTDVFGATPNNVARSFAQPGQVEVLAGLNLPMLVRVFNYPQADLHSLCEMAAEGGRRGIQAC